MTRVEMELEARPGRVVLRFTKGGETSEYPLSADGAEQFADKIQRAASRARELE